MPGPRLGLDVGDAGEDLVADERLLLEQRIGEAVERGTVLREQADGLVVGTVGQTRLLHVAQPLRLLGERVVVGAHRARDDALGHAVLEHHRPREVGHLLEVVRGAVRDAPEDDLLGGTARERDLHPVDELLAGVQVPLLVRQVERVAEGLAARDDRRLLHREGAAHEVRHERVAAFVVSEDPLLLLGHHAPLLQSGDHALHRVVEVRLVDVLLVLAPGEDRGFVRDVREVGAGQPGRLSRDRRQVDVGGERLAAGVDVEDRLAAVQVGRRDEDLAVEAAWAEQRRVEVLETVRGGHDDDLVAVVEAVQLDEQLVQRLILLAVEAVAGAGGADGVELVDEHDRGRVLARLLEELADACGAEAREHLDERRGALRVEVGARLVCDRLREQGLAGARRAVEEDALRDAGAELREPLRVAQEVDDLLHLLARLLEARDVLPRDGRLLARLDVRRLHARHHLEGAPEQVDDQAEHDDGHPDQGDPADLAQGVTDVRHLRASSAASVRSSSPPQAVPNYTGRGCASCPCPSSTGRSGSARSGASRTRIARARHAPGRSSTASRPPRKTASASACSRSTSRTRSASPASSSSSAGARGRAPSTITAASANSSTATSARSRRSSPAWTRTARCRFSTPFGSSTTRAGTRSPTRSSRPRTSRAAAGVSTRQWRRASASIRTTQLARSPTTRGASPRAGSTSSRSGPTTHCSAGSVMHSSRPSRKRSSSMGSRGTASRSSRSRASTRSPSTTRCSAPKSRKAPTASSWRARMSRSASAWPKPSAEREPHDGALRRLPDNLETALDEELEVAHVVVLLRAVRVRLQHGGRALPGVLDRAVEQHPRDAFALSRTIDDEAHDRPDILVVVLRPVLRRFEERRVVLPRRDGDPADGLAPVVGEQPGLAAGAGERAERTLLRRAVREAAVAPEHAPAAVARHVSMAAARPAALEEIDEVGPAVPRHRVDPELAHSTSSSLSFGL